jgi:hypothetical protein
LTASDNEHLIEQLPALAAIEDDLDQARSRKAGQSLREGRGMTEPQVPADSGTAGDARPQLVQDAEMIVRDLYYKHLTETIKPFDEAVRRVLETCLRRGLESGSASSEERDLAARLGISL